MDSSTPARLLGTAAAALALPAALLLLSRLARLRTARRRRHLLPATAERVLILGASSGVGRAIAKRYAQRGARVCIVGRRADRIRALEEECAALGQGQGQCLGQVADITVVADLVRVRSALEEAWGGLDTIHVVAGVSALQPLMALTGREGEGDGDGDASAQGIQTAVEIAGRAVQGNFTGPLVAALTFIPMLERTSPSPSILLVSSVAALVPAPTRALYAATKAASLLLYQALAIEHRRVAFTFLLPSTIEGSFRASAVDAGPVREADPNKQGLKTAWVAERCVAAVDGGERGSVIVPRVPFVLAHHLYYLWPGFVEARAAKKYNFE